MKHHLILYDGVCGLCNGLIQFLLKRDHRGVFRFASLQSEIGRSLVERFGGNPDEMTSVYAIEHYDTDRARVFNKSDAALFIAGELGWPWKSAVLLRVVPAVLRNVGYDFVARNRYRVFGRLEQCVMPTPESRSRFVD